MYLNFVKDKLSIEKLLYEEENFTDWLNRNISDQSLDGCCLKKNSNGL